MAAGITSKSGTEAQRAALVEREALAREVAGLRRQLGERDAQVAHLADLVAEAEAARARALAPTSAASQNAKPSETASSPPDPAAAAANAKPSEIGQADPPADPAAAAYAAEDTELSGLAIFAGMPGGPEKGSRRFWMRAIERLGRHLASDAHPSDQQRAARADPRGRTFVEARQVCRE